MSGGAKPAKRGAGSANAAPAAAASAEQKFFIAASSIGSSSSSGSSNSAAGDSGIRGTSASSSSSAFSGLGDLLSSLQVACAGCEPARKVEEIDNDWCAWVAIDPRYTIASLSREEQRALLSRLYPSAIAITEQQNAATKQWQLHLAFANRAELLRIVGESKRSDDADRLRICVRGEHGVCGMESSQCTADRQVKLALPLEAKAPAWGRPEDKQDNKRRAVLTRPGAEQQVLACFEKGGIEVDSVRSENWWQGAGIPNPQPTFVIRLHRDEDHKRILTMQFELWGQRFSGRQTVRINATQCTVCGGDGHVASACPNRDSIMLRFACCRVVRPYEVDAFRDYLVAHGMRSVTMFAGTWQGNPRPSLFFHLSTVPEDMMRALRLMTDKYHQLFACAPTPLKRAEMAHACASCGGEHQSSSCDLTRGSSALLLRAVVKHMERMRKGERKEIPQSVHRHAAEKMHKGKLRDLARGMNWCMQFVADGRCSFNTDTSSCRRPHPDSDAVRAVYEARHGALPGAPSATIVAPPQISAIAVVDRVIAGMGASAAAASLAGEAGVGVAAAPASPAGAAQAATSSFSAPAISSSAASIASSTSVSSSSDMLSTPPAGLARRTSAVNPDRAARMGLAGGSDSDMMSDDETENKGEARGSSDAGAAPRLKRKERTPPPPGSPLIPGLSQASEYTPQRERNEERSPERPTSETKRAKPGSGRGRGGSGQGGRAAGQSARGRGSRSPQHQ